MIACPAVNKKQLIVLWLGTGSLLVSVLRPPIKPWADTLDLDKPVHVYRVTLPFTWKWIWTADKPKADPSPSVPEIDFFGRDIDLPTLLAEWVAISIVTGAAVLTLQTKSRPN